MRIVLYSWTHQRYLCSDLGEFRNFKLNDLIWGINKQSAMFIYKFMQAKYSIIKETFTFSQKHFGILFLPWHTILHKLIPQEFIVGQKLQKKSAIITLACISKNKVGK